MMAKDKVSFTGHPRRQHALLALALSGVEWKGSPDKLLWECIAALGVYGPSARLKRRFDTVRAAALINRDLPMDGEDREKIAASLNELGGYILRLIGGMENIEKKISNLGCRVNPETGKVTFKRGGKGKDVVRDRIWEIYTENYRKEYQAATRRQCAIRKEIGDRPELANHIDERELIPDAKAGALIYDTIRRGEFRSK
jgi:hypothetical protein